MMVWSLSVFITSSSLGAGPGSEGICAVGRTHSPVQWFAKEKDWDEVLGLWRSSEKMSSFCFLFCRQGVIVWPSLTSCLPLSCLPLPSIGVIGIFHHTRQGEIFYNRHPFQEALICTSKRMVLITVSHNKAEGTKRSPLILCCYFLCM